jgi:hypothetical protein
MTTHNNAHVTPHRYAVDLSPLEGREVLGESLAVLFSFALRIKFEAAAHGMASFSGTCPQHEIDALTRAMERVEPDTAGDQRTPEQRDADRLVAVLFQVTAAACEGPTAAPGTVLSRAARGEQRPLEVSRRGGWPAGSRRRTRP